MQDTEKRQAAKTVVPETTEKVVLEGDETLLTPLNTIRSETTLSRLPIHNLSKKGSVSIHIKKTDRQGALELRWITKYGQAGQPGPLAYKLDTLIVNRRIDEQRHRLEKTIALGSLYQICRELGKGTSGKDMNDVKKALEQNAFLGIDAFVKYEDKNGEKRTLEAKFHRYDVVMKGGEMADGTTADCVYIILSEPYYKILTQSPTRPLDYDYLKMLSPGAQRFYEILSFKMYRALMSREDQARLIYSEYCINAPQKRYSAQSKVEAQMDALQKPHLESGYINGVEYRKIKDEEGKPDWEILYTVGPRARAFHHAFNRNARNLEAAGREVLLSAPVRLTDSPDLLLVKRFHQLARGIEHYETASARELTLASRLLKDYGEEGATYILEFAIKEARKTNFKMQSFGAIQQYVVLAAEAWQTHLMASQPAIQSVPPSKFESPIAPEDSLRKQAEALFQEMEFEQKTALLARKRQEILTKTPVAREWSDDVMNSTLEASVIRELMVQLQPV